MDDNSRISILGITMGFVFCVVLISLTSCEREKMLLETIRGNSIKTTYQEMNGK